MCLRGIALRHVLLCSAQPLDHPGSELGPRQPNTAAGEQMWQRRLGTRGRARSGTRPGRSPAECDSVAFSTIDFAAYHRPQGAPDVAVNRTIGVSKPAVCSSEIGPTESGNPSCPGNGRHWTPNRREPLARVWYVYSPYNITSIIGR